MLGLFGSVALVVCLMRKNVIQGFAGEIFGASQLTRAGEGTEFVPDSRKMRPSISSCCSPIHRCV